MANSDYRLVFIDITISLFMMKSVGVQSSNRKPERPRGVYFIKLFIAVTYIAL